MYGLLLDSIQKFITESYGERIWASVRQRAGLKNRWFVTHEVYSDQVIRDLVAAASEELGEPPSLIMKRFGEFFVQSIGHYGYARLLRVLGRNMRDFLNGLDDLHEYLRFSYPQMKPPSFFCESETHQGMLLHYTTKRRGFIDYVVGQLITVGHIYGKELDVVQVSLEDSGTELHYVLELRFDNSELLMQAEAVVPRLNYAVDSEQFLGVFPFCFVFDCNLVIQWVGSKLAMVLPNLSGQTLNDAFCLEKPQFCSLVWNLILTHSNCVFELVSTESVTRPEVPATPDLNPEAPPPTLKLKGEMMLLKEAKSIAFLCSPVLDSPEDLYQSGIFINDLSKHDSSRDYILTGSHHNPELNLALHQEKIRSAQLEESAKRTDQLLYQMIPKPIADQLRSGQTPLNTCREYDNVSVLFSDVVSFTPMCSRLRPMEVVCVLNAMCVAFDQLCDKHGVYKVEMIGDGYMVICGAPEAQPRHAELITDFAYSIIDATSKINDPSTNQSLKIRVGIHSGPIVAGVLGNSILRYDVFGDTVNVAARMEATGQPMRIHMSEATANLLKNSHFKLEQRGRVEVKGKGMMTTYWVQGVRDEVSHSPSPPPSPRPVRSQLTLAPSFKKLSPEPHQWPLADQLSARRRSALTVECPHQSVLLGSSFQLSELNLLNIRESISLGGTNGDELTRFAALAEENARQARLLADVAGDMVRQVTGATKEVRRTSTAHELAPNDQAQTERASYACVIL